MERQSAQSSAIKRTILKGLSTAALSLLIALESRLHLDTDSINKAITHLSALQLLGYLFILFISWLIVEFLDACIRELAGLAQEGGKVFARYVTQIPRALANVSGRLWDRVDALASHWSFEKRYRRRLSEDYGSFNDRGLGLINAARLELEHVFVDLQLSTLITSPRSSLLADSVNGRQSIWDFLRSTRAGLGLVLLGPPGSGKTTLLQYMLLVFANGQQGRYKHRARLPILIELRYLKDAFGTEASHQPSNFNLVVAIRSYWSMNARLADLMKTEPPGWLESQLRSSRVLLLLDGLDEVPEAKRNAVSRWVQNQMRYEDYRQCLFLLTSRPGGYLSAPLTDATVLEIQPFTRTQIDRFIDRWYLADVLATPNRKQLDVAMRRKATTEANNLRAKLREYPSLQDLTVNPLLLTMVCMVHRYRGHLPRSRAALYEEICKVLLERWRQAKENSSEELTGEQKLAVLRPLAYAFMARQTREMSQAEIVLHIDNSLEYISYKKPNDPDAGLRFLHYVQASSGLLLEQEAGHWSFAHKTFQEYLASDHWVHNQAALPNWDTLVTQDWWHDALLLYAARADASNLIASCLRIKTIQSWALGFQCLTEDPRVNPDIRREAEETLRMALRSENPEVFMNAARAWQHLQQKDIRDISDLVEQRVSLVTNAEYQLFLFDKSMQRALVPPHWTGIHFDGPPEDPILGLWPWQASQYAKFVSPGGFSLDWRLPSATESNAIQQRSAVYWRNDGNAGRTSLEPKGTYIFEDDLIPAGLNQELWFDIKQVHRITEALHVGLWISEGPQLDIAQALANSLNIVLARAFGRDVNRAHQLAQLASFDTRFVYDLVETLQKSSLEAVALRLHHLPTADRGGTSSTEMSWSLARPARRPRKRPPDIEGASITRHRTELLAGLSNIFEEEPSETRVVRLRGWEDQVVKSPQKFRWTESDLHWRGYGATLCGIALPSLRGELRETIARLEQTWRVINDRVEKRRLPREGIQLVRDKRTTYT